MTAVEMQEAFFIELTLYGRRATVDSEDIFYYLNKAQDEMVHRWFNGQNEQGKGFGQSQQITEYLRPLVVKNTSVSSTYIGSIQGDVHADKVQLPSDHLFLISSRSIVKDTTNPAQTPGSPRVGTGTARKVLNKQIQSDDIYRLLDDPFNTPIKTDPLVDLSGNELHIFTSASFVVTDVEMNYVKRPTAIGESTNTELDEFVHNDIVDLAVTMFLDKNREVRDKQDVTELTNVT
jgi:hypothetical protein